MIRWVTILLAFPFSSLRVIRATVWASLCHRATVWCLLLHCQLVCFELGPEIIRGRIYSFCSNWNNWTRSYWGDVGRLQEIGAHGGGSRGGQESTCAGHPGLWRQRWWSHSHPTLQVQRTGAEVQTTFTSTSVFPYINILLCFWYIKPCLLYL